MGCERVCVPVCPPFILKNLIIKANNGMICENILIFASYKRGLLSLNLLKRNIR